MEWIPDEEATNCTVCNARFTKLKRRHHCRSCGRLVCGPCSRQTSRDVNGFQGENVRICSDCAVSPPLEPFPVDQIMTEETIRDQAWRHEQGVLWLTESGALTLKSYSLTSFEEYAIINDVDLHIFSESITTIDKDVPRTASETADFPLWQDLLKEEEERRKREGSSGFDGSLRKVLVALVKRLQTGEGACGYTQGWSWQIAVLMLFIPDEEDVFWLFAQLVENIIWKDFYVIPIPTCLMHKESNTMSAPSVRRPLRSTEPWPRPSSSRGLWALGFTMSSTPGSLKWSCK